MTKKRTPQKRRAVPSSTADSRTLQKPARLPAYEQVLSGMKQLIAASRYQAASTVNRELVCLYWNIGRVIVQQQETANWGDAVVERLAKDLRTAFPEMKGLSTDNVFRMRKFYASLDEMDQWLSSTTQPSKSVSWVDEFVGAAPPQILSTASRELIQPIVGALPPQFRNASLQSVIASLSWTHLTMVVGAVSEPAARYFYMQMSARERWSVRELRRQIDAALYQRYMESKRHPEKCLPADAERGNLLPFKDHYIMEFLGLEDEHSEKQLRKAILANLRDFFLEFGKDLTFVGEEYPITIGGETFYIDLLFYHRRLQCLIAVDLKKGRFKPEYVGKSQFYVAALDEYVRLPHENPSVGLILCRDANHVHVKLALSTAAKKIGIATYQTALPAERDIQRRLAQLPAFDDPSDEEESA